MAEERAQRRLAAILAADVVGYSRMMREDEAGTLAQLKTLRKEVFDPRIADHNGRIVKTTGDGVLVEFASAVDATECAIKIQRGLARRNEDVPEGHRIELRIGINLGDIIVDGEDIYGDGVNVAARLEGLCDTGEVYVSAVVHDQVEGKIDAAFDDLGEHMVKNIDKPVRVYRASMEAGSAEMGSVATEVDKLFERPAVAVLPFTNMGGDPEQEYFSDGLTEDIITMLAAWRSFPVVARNSTFAYKGQAPNVRQVAKDLGARYVIEGSVRKGGNRLRITAQLIDADTGLHVWAEKYDREMEDIFELQDAITQRIAATVEPELEKAEHRRISAKKPTNLDAWDYYQRGMSLLHEFTKEGNAKAREMFERAIELDPTYGQAYSGIAQTHHRDIVFDFTESREESAAQCLESARQAVAIDDMDSAAHWVLGLGFQWSGQHDLSVAEERRAVELNPSNAQAYVSLGTSLAYAGRPEEGIPYIEKSTLLNPQDPRGYLWLSVLARTHLNARNYEEAAESARNAIRRKSDHPLAYVYLASSLAHLERWDEAQVALDDLERVKPGYAEHWINLQVSQRAPVGNEHILDGLRKASLPK